MGVKRKRQTESRDGVQEYSEYLAGKSKVIVRLS